MQVIVGPRQVGKTTMVRDVVAASGIPHHYATADEPTLRGANWLRAQWDIGRLKARTGAAVLVLDEVQKAPGWSDWMKALWDEDTRRGTQLKVVALGSAPLLVQRGLSESLAGRFETIRLPHWSPSEMRAAFGWDVEASVFYGGYPGAAPLIAEPERWARYVKDSIIETTVARDVLLLTRVDKPALLRRVFELACRYSCQILSYTKMLGQLQDAGNTVTVAHYIELLQEAGMLMALQKYSAEAVRRRASSPKLLVQNTALITAQASMSLEDARADSDYWGRLVESAVGSHLANAASTERCELYYWRENGREVDFVVRSGRAVTAIQVKSGRPAATLPGTAEFVSRFRPTRTLLVGSGGIPLDEFLLAPVEHWIGL